jgi:4'-phosphopantetheinyl transferase
VALRVWTVAIDSTPADRVDRFAVEWLSAEERLKHARFVTEELRREYLLTRALSRWALSQEAPEIAPRDWKFDRTDAGQPFVVGQGPTFNLSNAGNMIVCVVSQERLRVGIDVEPVSFAPDRTGKMFSDQEREFLARNPARAVDLWTLKEAYLKARGEGIAVHPHRVGLVLREDGDSATFEDGENLDRDASEWSLSLFHLADHAVAVAVRSANFPRERIVFGRGLTDTLPAGS